MNTFEKMIAASVVQTCVAIELEATTHRADGEDAIPPLGSARSLGVAAVPGSREQALILSLLIIGMSVPTGRMEAAIINAASASRANVGTAVDSAVDGDTVAIPAGTADWTTTLTINKAITLQGAGIGTTIVTTGVAPGQHLIIWNLVSNKLSRMTGLEFRPGSVPANFIQAIKLSGLNTDDRRIRIDHCKFNNLGNGVFLVYSTLGVFDHNTVLGSTSGVPAWLGYVKGNNWDGAQDVNTFGDGAWAAADQFGTAQFFFIEDNILSNGYSSHLTMLDSQAGGRFVFRNNKVYRGNVESHGLEASRERSGRAFEIYNNTFDGNDSVESVTYFRGGVALVYSNYVYGYGSPKLQLLNNRLSDNLAAPFGGSDGRNPWDINDPGNPFSTGTASSAGTLTVTDNTKSWITDQWKGFVVRRTSGKPVSSMTRSGSTVTVKCTSHGFTNGQKITILGANQQPYNATYTLTVLDANTFSVQNDWIPATPATGTIYAVSGNHFSEITGNTATELTFKDSIYSGSYTLRFAAGDTFEINRVIHGMDMTGSGPGSLLTGVSPTIPTGGIGEVTSAWYEWNNIRCTTGPATLGAAGTDIDFSPIPKLLIVENVHYFNDTVKPGYVPYIYPHPLVSGVTNTPPKSPTGLHTLASP